MRAVLDSSVPIAYFKQENGWQTAQGVIPQSYISPVNVIELATFLARHSMPKAKITEVIRTFPFTIAELTHEQLLTAGALVQTTQSYGLSLGDRACLALAISHKLPVFTADKIWTTLTLPIEIRLIR